MMERLVDAPQAPPADAILVPRQGRVGAEAGAETPPAPAAGARRPRLYVLDGLRLFAALMVVAWHFGAGAPWDVWNAERRELFGFGYSVSIYGWLGVQLFFLISGFVICMSSWDRGPGHFAISRVVRLYPAYWLCVVLTFVVLVFYPHPSLAPLRGSEMLGNLTMFQHLLKLPNVDPSYWTLAVELQFYLLFMFVVAKSVSYQRVVVFCVVWNLASIAVPPLGFPHLSALIAASEAPYFTAGVAIYLIYRFGPNLLLWGLVAFSWVMSAIYVPRQVEYNFGEAVSARQKWISVAIVTVFFLIMIAVALGWFNWLNWRWLTVAGALTYPLYLIHQIVGQTVITLARDLLPPWLLLGAVTALMLVFAWIVHRYWERPFARWLKKRLTSSLEQVVAAGPKTAAPGGQG
jgi:peptidoglycan/LPS O-acetylase OafA/YrhL